MLTRVPAPSARPGKTPAPTPAQIAAPNALACGVEGTPTGPSNTSATIWVQAGLRDMLPASRSSSASTPVTDWSCSTFARKAYAMPSRTARATCRRFSTSGGAVRWVRVRFPIGRAMSRAFITSAPTVHRTPIAPGTEVPASARSCDVGCGASAYMAEAIQSSASPIDLALLSTTHSPGTRWCPVQVRACASTRGRSITICTGVLVPAMAPI